MIEGELMEIFESLWNSVNILSKASSLLQWMAFGLIFLGLLLGIAKHFVDQREKKLIQNAQEVKETVRVERERVFERKIESLKSEIIERKKDISELEKKTVPVNPYLQLIRTAIATIEIIVKSNENIDTKFMDRGGYMAFAKGNKALLIMSGTSCTARQLGDGRVLYRGVFELDATSEATKENILFLKDADYVQIGFSPMPEKVQVLSGKAICTLNNLVRVEFIVPNQQMQKDFIIVPNSKVAMTDFKE